ncbi:hypothetical protein EKE94_18055 [Mesobaculum littorinae]|uniref:Uncharacterized protein n=1 Tax=Mesobaculum littorinae TaxID=2486419 RepID=A0A438ACY8_9RHOB|nr:hypothetical protein [Mesobaculum littorinae]RVV96550.1 hypothetical protein EKE94_18055 [Mesobaculum littorinae]
MSRPGTGRATRTRAIAAIGALGLVLGLGAGIAPLRGATPYGTDIRPEITADGAARFVAVAAGRYHTAWTVSCRVPLRGCMARGQEVVLRLDAHGAARLLAAVAPGARLSLEGAGPRRDLAGLFAQPLSGALVRRLSLPRARLVIEEPGHPARSLSLAGLSEAVDYLGWLATYEARSTRDARLWPGIARAAARQG